MDSSAESLELVMCGCKGLDSIEPARHLLRLLAAAGCEFLKAPPDIVGSDPEQRVKKSGSIVVPLHFRHDQLGPDVLAVQRRKPGSGSLSFLVDARAVVVHQTVHPSGKGFEKLAQGLLEFGKLIYPIVRPAFGWIDDPGENSVAYAIRSLSDIRFLYWINFFGPEMVTAIGESVFRNCRDAKTEKMDDGGILLIAADDFDAWTNKPPTEMARRFARKMPHIRLYRVVR